MVDDQYYVTNRRMNESAQGERAEEEVPEKKEVMLCLTEEQRRQIKEATGQDIFELKVEMFKALVNPARSFSDRAAE